MPDGRGFTAVLSEIPGILWEKTLEAFGGSVPIYEKVLRVTARLLPENIARLEDLYETAVPESLELYSLEAHGLKGVLRNIGAYELGETSYCLELLSKENDLAACAKIHPGFIRELTAFSNELSRILSDPNRAVKHGDASGVLKALPTLMQAAEAFDGDSALKALSRLRRFTYGEDIDRTIADLENMFERFAFGEALKLVEKLRELVETNGQHGV
ncbi:MAG: Hpt domain-containing protein [Oscillospiraceae bacterium]|jgi:HPt (histidine-containing phosphotransfer) domain-containing protein|nr:Hpt domain-containing protein [Oscillospiraceae bacterium]